MKKLFPIMMMIIISSACSKNDKQPSPTAPSGTADTVKQQPDTVTRIYYGSTRWVYDYYGGSPTGPVRIQKDSTFLDTLVVKPNIDSIFFYYRKDTGWPTTWKFKRADTTHYRYLDQSDNGVEIILSRDSIVAISHSWSGWASSYKSQNWTFKGKR